MALSPEKQMEMLKSATAEIISEEELLSKLKKKKPLRIKLGIDPSGPEIHLGFSVVLRKLRQFQELGHTAVIIVGDFTGMIGDPSGVSRTRPKLTKEQVENNMERYKEQIFMILDKEKTTFTYNSTWLGALTMYEFIELAAKYTVARILERDDFEQRLKTGQPVYMHEIMYPLCQGYDSVSVEADVELEGTDGVRKMSKSYDIYIGITESPDSMFGKIMSIPDALICKYFALTTDLFAHTVDEYRVALEAGTVNPRDVKFELARTIVRMYHSPSAAEKAAADFEKVFTKKQLPGNIKTHTVKAAELTIVDLLVQTGLMKSRGEAKRKIREGAIDIDGVCVSDINHIVRLTKPVIVRAGKHKFLQVVSA
jgi:tyrosyl-tRNA synthetase